MIISDNRMLKYPRKKQKLFLGNPDPPEILSGEVADRKNSYTLIWKSELRQNITTYQIMNRKLPVS